MEWISVEDRLPLEANLVLVSDINGMIFMGYCTMIESPHPEMLPYQNVNWHVVFLNGGDDLASYPITHWMPLPDPPEDSD